MNARRLEHLAILELPLESRTVLEIGAGVGDLTAFFLDRSCTVTSLEPQDGNVALFRRRYQDNEFWPQDRLRIIQDGAENFANNPDIDPCQIVFSYGLLHRLDNLMTALRNMSAYCTDLFLLETDVEYGPRDGAAALGTEDSADFANSIERACSAPGRRWLFNRLRELFEFVYVPLLQPAHEQFRLDWRKARAGRSRAIFVASRNPISNPYLVDYLPDIQFSSLPSMRSIPVSDPGGTLVLPSCFGPLRVYENDLITNQIKEFGAHTRNEVALLRTFVGAGDLVYDIGAHIGTFAIPLSDAAGASGRVIAVEANPRHFELLTANLSTRGLARDGSPILAAVSDAAHRYGVQSIPGNSGASYLAIDPEGAVRNTIRLDDLHRSVGGGRAISVIKVDVEGMELSVLKSGEAVISRDKPILYLEIAAKQLERYGVAVSEIESFLKGLGYRFFKNAGKRNSAEDNFDLVELPDLASGGPFFDLLAVATANQRLADAVTLSGKAGTQPLPKFTRAIVYVAWGEKHIAEAIKSARSAAHVGVDRLLITDAQSRLLLPPDKPFEAVIPHEFRLPGQLAKTEMFDLLPQAYDSFLFLDSDTVIMLDIDQAFERSEAHGIAVAPAASYGLEHFWGFGQVLDQMNFRSHEILQYNSGAIFFTRNEKAWQVMQKWHQLCREATGNVAAWGDQPYLTLAMELLQFNPYTLSIAYNYRNFGELISGKVRIWHSHMPPPPDLNTFVKPWPPRRFRKGQRLEDSG